MVILEGNVYIRSICRITSISWDGYNGNDPAMSEGDGIFFIWLASFLWLWSLAAAGGLLLLYLSMNSKLKICLFPIDLLVMSSGVDECP